MTRKKRRTGLSKSRFLAGLQCLKRLHLICNEPELAPETDAGTQARFDTGHQVGELAQQGFPGGVLVDLPYWDVANGVERTKEIMADKSVPAIFEATLTRDDIVIRADVMERGPGSRWRLIEVKSSTSVKDVHVPDVAIQKHVLEGNGIVLGGACLMHLNRDYVYDGATLDPRELFTIEDVSEDVRGFETQIPDRLKEQRAALAGSSAPQIAPGPQCTEPYECEFYSLCNPELPLGHVSTLYRLRDPLRQALEDAGIERIADITNGFRLSAMQRRMVDCVKSGATYVGPQLRKGLGQLRYPLCFMDFETTQPAVPRFGGMCPYDMLPFQWSVHVVDRPGADAKHYEYLSDDGADPREEFTAGLLDVVEREGRDGHIVVYNQVFEIGRLTELASWRPAYARRIAAVQDRVWDLLPVIRKNVYHPDFCGSFSIKSVLPALIPELSYEGMEVSEGEEAGLAYERLISGDMPASERERLRRALLEYCKLDTLAMVRLMDRLRALQGT